MTCIPLRLFAASRLLRFFALCQIANLCQLWAIEQFLLEPSATSGRAVGVEYLMRCSYIEESIRIASNNRLSLPMLFCKSDIRNPLSNPDTSKEHMGLHAF